LDIGEIKRIGYNHILRDESVIESTGIIKLLPPEIANKIAAGEVVQRPSSVVKELLDNAIDAGSTKIVVNLVNAGRTSIQVLDNGCGMSKDDLPLCFLRHATSKINTVDDLYAIRTLGFRGEAMASIASVAQVTLKSKRIEDSSGTIYELWGGEERRFEPVATDNGTSISVDNLFFNVPARRAFLKTDTTELRHCIIIFQQMAMANPSIEFELNADSEKIYKLPSQSLNNRIADIFGKPYLASLLSIDETAGFMRVYGYLIDPKLTKRNRGEQFLYVNGRPIMHRHLTHIILEQYKHWIRDQEFPFFALFYEVDPTLVDVNVHPAKMEIKFEDERSVSGLTKSVVKRALHQRFQVPGINHEEREEYEPFMGELTGKGNIDSSEPNRPVRNIPSRINFDKSRSGRLGIMDGLYERHPNSPLNSPSGFDSLSPSEAKFKRPEREKEAGFWQLHQSYIIAQTLTGLCMVDQHAAHKRIIYERAILAAESGLPSTQQLLFPETIQLSATDFTQLKVILPELLRLGFDISLMSGFSAIINGVPADIKLGDEKSLLQSMIQQYHTFSNSLNLEPRERIALALANKTAIPRGKKLTLIEMETLVDQLFSCSQPYIDPLNKPTISYLALDEIRSRFRNH
jgi:DNA mismatch repair protein MutL